MNCSLPRAAPKESPRQPTSCSRKYGPLSSCSALPGAALVPKSGGCDARDATLVMGRVALARFRVQIGADPLGVSPSTHQQAGEGASSRRSKSPRARSGSYVRVVPGEEHDADDNGEFEDALPTAVRNA
jgi:hypothetical protein